MNRNDIQDLVMGVAGVAQGYARHVIQTRQDRRRRRWRAVARPQRPDRHEL